MRRFSSFAILVLSSISLLCCTSLAPKRDALPKRNAILFVADGLRHGVVTAKTMPNLFAMSRQGTRFENSHALYPTVTMANASAIATGRMLSDTGIYANTLFTGFPFRSAAGSPLVFIETNPILVEGNEHYDEDWLNGETLVSAARKAGFQTAVIGKQGPAYLQNMPGGDRETLVVDDQTGTSQGRELPRAYRDAFATAGLPLVPPARGDNGRSGDNQTPGTLVANLDQQTYFARVATEVVLPRFQKEETPFVLVFWSRDPDGSQHNQGDSFGKLAPGINGPTTIAALANADRNLGELRHALDRLGLADSTDIVVTSDHGFSVISKTSRTSVAAKRAYPDTVSGKLPAGFLAIDLAHALGLKVFDADRSKGPGPLAENAHSMQALLGAESEHPVWAVAANGGTDFLYLIDESQAAQAVPKAVSALLSQDYVSGIFVNDRFGHPAGTLPLSAIRLEGKGRTPLPTIVVGFRSFFSGDKHPLCANRFNCGAIVADTSLQEGQGNHGSFGRQDTFNFQAAFGPDFKKAFADTAPTSNADLAITLAQALRIKLTEGKTSEQTGRVLREALVGGEAVGPIRRGSLESSPAGGALRTVVKYQDYDGQRYFDVGGFPGRTLGLD